MDDESNIYFAIGKLREEAIDLAKIKGERDERLIAEVRSLKVAAYVIAGLMLAITWRFI